MIVSRDGNLDRNQWVKNGSLIAAMSSGIADLSVRGHGSLRGRAVRLMMVFGGGSSPMSFAG